jgi:hypothetical protein
MSLSLLLIPIFLVTLVLWVAWPLLAEPPGKPAPTHDSRKKTKR